MSYNELMHPRNIYRKPPDFKQLAILFPEFRKHIKQSLTGKVNIDFKDAEALRALTTTLLKKDFCLDVEIPMDRLVPTVPLRLNYVLWIEDLLNVAGVGGEVKGIDIGTGAACIYCLLGAKTKGWHMTGTEIDNDSVNYALRNVENNSLSHLITIKQVTGKNILLDVVDPNVSYDFCMCNPPFFNSPKDVNPFLKARTNRRPPPHNAYTATTGEVVSKGGEIEFVSRIVKESVQLKQQIRVYTTMIGQKSSLTPIKSLLKMVEVSSYKQTAFYQGVTTRWCLAWTYCPIDLTKAPQANTKGPKKKYKPPLTYVLPFKSKDYTVKHVAEKVKEIFDTLEVCYEQLKGSQIMRAFEATAKRNTWTGLRRKRREQQRKSESETKNDSGLESNDCDKNEIAELSPVSATTNMLSEIEIPDTASNASGSSGSTPKRPHEDDDGEEDSYFNSKKFRKDFENEKSIEPIYLKCLVVVRVVNEHLILEISWIEGSAKRDVLFQLMQYFKNYLVKLVIGANQSK